MSDRIERLKQVEERFRLSPAPLSLELFRAREELRLFIRNSTMIPPTELWAAAFALEPERAVIVQKVFALLENLGSLLAPGMSIIGPSPQMVANFETRMAPRDASASERLLQLLFLADIEWVSLAIIQLLVRDRYNQESYEALMLEFAQLGINVRLDDQMQRAPST